ncbi:MAG: AAA family ATPase [Solobacterium sp.]|nr:AAA family ATPase [Solobacterium sp.]
MEKRKSAIEKIELDGRTYSHEEFHPTFINFFFGRNGAGKSTIAEAIQDNSGITWRTGRSADDYNVLVYNQQFISDHFSNYDDLVGVFTLNKVNIDIQKKVDQLNKDSLANLNDLGKKAEEISAKETARADAKSESQDRMMRLTEPARKKFDLALSGKKIKKTFCPEVEKKTPVEHTEDEIQELYDVAYDKNARPYEKLKKSEFAGMGYDLSNESILGEPIISTSTTSFAQAMERIGNTDWVKEGFSKYVLMAGEGEKKVCPFCHQPLIHDGHDIVQEIKNCFDETYQENVGKVTAFQSAYHGYTSTLLQTFDRNLQSDFPRADFTLYKEKLERLRTVIQSNLALIQSKVDKPAEEISIENISDLVNELDGIIDSINSQIQTNNDAVNKKRETKIKCEKMLWEYLAFLVKDEIEDFKNKDKTFADELVVLNKEKAAIKQKGIDIQTEIRSERGKTVNTDAAFESMNAMLKDSGFQGFSLRKKTGSQNRYEVVREGGKPVRHLSEGERNFIAFLYFYHLVKGSGTADAAYIGTDGSIEDATDTRDKIVVIDDPVTSMDSGTLFIVSSMIREMISVCHNNVELLHPDITGSYIKQIFILTHNAYFHREVTYDMAEHFDTVTFYMVRKVDNHSTVKPSVHLATEMSDEDRNINPVQNAYTALWTEYKELQSSIPLLNVIRRILQYYFMELCGFKGNSIRDVILKRNKAEFITQRPDGSIDDTDYTLASSMLSYIDNEYSFIDGFNLVQETAPPEQYRKVMRKIFEKMHQSQHYDMMTK